MLNDLLYQRHMQTFALKLSMNKQQGPEFQKMEDSYLIPYSTYTLETWHN